MATFSSVTRQHVLQALTEYDARGADDFLALYGFGPSRGYTLVHEGRGYDSKAVLGVAHRYATGRLATPEEFHGGMDGAVRILRKRGFEVTEPASVTGTASGTTRTTRASRSADGATRVTGATRTTGVRRTTAREAPAQICPTCSMALPATGVCDDCG